MRIHRYTQYTVEWNEMYIHAHIHRYIQYTVGWNERYIHAHTQVQSVHGGVEREVHTCAYTSTRIIR